MSVSITIILNDGSAITAQRATWKKAAEEVARMHDDPFYSRRGFYRIFLTEEGSAHPEQYRMYQITDGLRSNAFPD